MPHRRHTITAATSALFFVCLMLHAQGRLSAQAPAPYDDAEAYRVYESLLPEDRTLTVGQTHRLLIQAQTTSPEFCLKPEGESAALLQPLFDSFVALNQTTWQLQPDFSSGTSYELVSREDLHAFFSKPDGGGWEALAMRYPGSGHSYLMLSPVAFNADRTLAVVYMGYRCGSLCGNGTFHVLEKKDGVWKNLRWQGTSCAWGS